MRMDISAADARAMLDYNAETGKLFWKLRPLAYFKDERAQKIWNTRYAGSEAFTHVHARGYLCGVVCYRSYLAHRVVWLMCTGDWPNQQIDHINGVRSDNRFENLRDVSAAENMKNLTLQSRNRSGVPGVNWCPRQQKWRVYITTNRVMKSLGFFDDFDLAVAKRRAAEIENGFHPNHGRAA